MDTNLVEMQGSYKVKLVMVVLLYRLSLVNTLVHKRYIFLYNNRTIHGCLEIWNFSRVDQNIFHISAHPCVILYLWALFVGLRKVIMIEAFIAGFGA